MTAEVIQANPDITFSKRALLNLGDYRVHAPREGVLLSWMREVDNLRTIFTEDFHPEKLEQYLRGIQRHHSIKVHPLHIQRSIEEMKQRDTFDDESAQLLSIGCYVLHKKPGWRKIKASARVFTGGDYFMETFPFQDTINCIDLAVWMRVLADQYDIRGGLISTWDHTHYQSDTGKVLDPMSKPNTAGFFPNPWEYEFYCKSYS
ncbi:MAG: hypothetical protein NUV52_04175 [Candidatus Roizmanbacteria bacterium]|nr:hypothetical protein [Candidatus Roizmanbacteria bacterium]